MGNAPTLYGQPVAVIAVLVAINQPFTIWILRSFFKNIPAELDEAARVDGCTHFQAFRWVIMPVMWPGVITTGLFSFLLGYNDFLVTGPKITLNGFAEKESIGSLKLNTPIHRMGNAASTHQKTRKPAEASLRESGCASAFGTDILNLASTIILPRFAKQRE